MAKRGEQNDLGCFVWAGSRRVGYGALWNGWQMEGAHRVSWALTYGPVPPGKHVLHTCDNRACTTPEHLYLGTDVENARDRVDRGRAANGPRMASPGELNGNSKLEAGQVLQIRTLYATGGTSQRKLARQFNVTQPQIGYIVRREQWAHI